ncbi:hypothetical protein F5884DRAFT_903871 [Xylogone sp. PMI_703]|nr:hypothetical protein F5884DRAFT_903871 [Xylogone sp. PMI_703]
MAGTDTASANLAIEDFNQPSQERTLLLERLHKAIHADVPVHFWAACHFCGIDALSSLTNTAEHDVNAVLAMALMMHFIVAGWDESRFVMQPEGFESAIPTALKRDGSHCVLTGMGVVEPAFIYPPWMMDPEWADARFGDHRPAVFDLLQLFFTEERVAASKRALDIEKIHIQERAEGIFALKPVSISEDKTVLTMRFFWQSPFERSVAYYDMVNILVTPSSTQNLKGAAEAWLENEEGKRIESGQEFIIRTSDPIQRPLPSLEDCLPTYGETSSEEESEEELQYNLEDLYLK